MGDKIVKSKNLCCQPVVFHSLSLLKWLLHFLFLKKSWRKSGILSMFLKRLRLGKTTGWQHRFFDLTILSPIWLGTYDYMNNTLKILFFLKQGFQSGYFSDLVKNFQIWPCFCVHEKIIIFSILGAGKG